jgi:O-antigen/teichoic acid export membrane protein
MRGNGTMKPTNPAQDRAEYEGYLSTATKGAGFTFVGRLFGLVFGFAVQAVVARLLGADILGVFVLAWTIVMGLGILTTFGFEGSFCRYIAMYVAQGQEGKARAILSYGARFGLIASVVAAVALVAFRGPLSISVFKEPRLEQALLVISLAMIPYTLSRIYAAALRAVKDMKLSIIASEISFRLSRLVLFLLLFLVGMRLQGIVTATILAYTVSMLTGIIFIRRRAPYLLGRGPAADVPKREFLAYSGSMLAETTTAFALTQSGRLFLGFYLTATDVGIYNVVALLASLTTLFTVSFNAIFSPIIADVYHRGNEKLMVSLLDAITRWIILLTLPVFVWLVLAGEGVLSLFGAEFVVGYAALVVLGVAQLLDCMTGSIASCLAMTKYQRYNVYNTVAMAVVSVVLNAVLIPRMGIVGASVGTAGAIILVNIARLIEGKVLLGLIPYDRSTLKVAVTGAVLLGLALAARRTLTIPHDWYWSGFLLLLCYAVALLVALLLGIKEEDRAILASVLRKLGRAGRGQ